MNAYTENDIDIATVRDAPIAIIGYGSQGRAHAQNLRDSGCEVIIGARKGGPSWKRASEDGFEVSEPGEAASRACLVALLTPDMAHEAVYNEAIVANLSDGDAVLFAHGFSVHYGRVRCSENIDTILVAPKGPGDLVRREFVRGRGVPCLFAIENNATGRARDRALGYAAAIGGAAGSVIETSFAEETETDLFGEQAVLCGGATELVLAGYETLVEAGYQPEVAYFECMHELKLIVDLLYEGGLAKMHEFVSETAKYGDLTRGPRIITDETRARMREILSEIQDGEFAREWILENQAGLPRYNRLLDQDLSHAIEKTGADLRDRMPWLRPGANSAGD